jgi:peroxiredoxin
MARVTLNAAAPDFALEDFNGEMVRLSNYRDKSNVLLVFNRGFM